MLGSAGYRLALPHIFSEQPPATKRSEFSFAHGKKSPDNTIVTVNQHVLSTVWH